jgi:23S rRNA (pseudouridine1915-N3)-methyltransferase
MAKVGSLAVVAVGNLRTANWNTLQQDYLNRIQFYTRCQVFEVKDWYGKVPDGSALQKEGEALLQASVGYTWRVALTPSGTPFTSHQFADWLLQRVEQYHKIAFLLGGPAGFGEAVLPQMQEQISLSRMTFPHELARILLLEQVFRAFTLLNGTAYHK